MAIHEHTGFSYGPVGAARHPNLELPDGVADQHLIPLLPTLKKGLLGHDQFQFQLSVPDHEPLDVKVVRIGHTTGFVAWRRATEQGVRVDAVTLLLTGIDRAEEGEMINRLRQKPELQNVPTGSWDAARLCDKPGSHTFYLSEAALNDPLIFEATGVFGVAFFDLLGKVD